MSSEQADNFRSEGEHTASPKPMVEGTPRPEGQESTSTDTHTHTETQKPAEDAPKE